MRNPLLLNMAGGTNPFEFTPPCSNYLLCYRVTESTGYSPYTQHEGAVELFRVEDPCRIQVKERIGQIRVPLAEACKADSNRAQPRRTKVYRHKSRKAGAESYKAN